MSGVYLGIDQSFNGFGLCWLVPHLDWHHTTVTRFPAKKYGTGVDRLAAIGSWLNGQFDSVGLIDPAHIVMEGYARGRAHRREEMGELAAVVKLALRLRYKDPVRYPTVIAPMQLKRFATGDGRADKAKVMRFVKHKWGEEFTDDNKADAFVAAMVAMALDTGHTVDPYEREVIEKLKPHTERMAA